MVLQDFYTQGEYLQKNPDWHVESSPWKTKGIVQMMARNTIRPKTVCEIGCGAGEILKLLQQQLDSECSFWGYEIAPQAVELAKSRENTKLRFKLGDVRDEKDSYFDLILIIDVLEHFEDCFTFLRDIKPLSEYKILLLPLDINVVSVLRGQLLSYHFATGHLHYFTKEIALQLLKENGYEVLDYFYTAQPNIGIAWDEIRKNPLKLPKRLLGFFKRSLVRMPRELFFSINQDLAVRIFGERKLVVLVK